MEKLPYKYGNDHNIPLFKIPIDPIDPIDEFPIDDPIDEHHHPNLWTKIEPDEPDEPDELDDGGGLVDIKNEHEHEHKNDDVEVEIVEKIP